jgi:hypothetical protein
VSGKPLTLTGPVSRTLRVHRNVIQFVSNLEVKIMSASEWPRERLAQLREDVVLHLSGLQRHLEPSAYELIEQWLASSRFC